jgi:hypothetical protein
MLNWPSEPAFPHRRVYAGSAPWNKRVFIKGYHAEINAEAMGFGVTIFAHGRA